MAKGISLPASALQASDPKHIRNVALLGHTQSGKTQLAEALLGASGRILPLGIVDTSAALNRQMDSGDDERERGITYQLNVASTAWRSADKSWTKINLIDTPGLGGLFSDAYAAMKVAAGGILCVSAHDGVKTITRRAYRAARDCNMGLLVAVTKLDKENTDFFAVSEKLKEQLDRGVVPVNLPIGKAAKFKGVVNLLSMKAYLYADDGSGDETEVDIPADMLEQAQEARTVIEELAAETDEELLEKYFEEGELSGDDFVRGVRAGVKDGSIIPVLAVSSTHQIGMRQVLERIVKFLPSPADQVMEARPDEGEELVELAADPAADPTCFVFRTAIDPYAGTISYMRVGSGSIATGADVQNQRGTSNRLAHIFAPVGTKLDEIEAAVAGDIVCAVKLKDIKTGDTIRSKGGSTLFDPVAYPVPALSVSLTAASRAHEDKLGGSLDRLLAEDPRLAIDRDPESHEFMLKGAGQLHIEMALGRLKSRYGVEVEPHAPSIPYRETIKSRIDLHARHKKQTGGSGQFADIKAIIEPLPSGEGFVFEEKIVGGSVPKNYIPAVEKGLEDARAKGALAGYPAVDFKVTLYDGQHHPVDSSDMAFQIVGRKAFREGWPKAKPTLLEPVMHVEINVPEECTGDVMGDLNRRRGRVRGMNSDGDETTVEAEVPLAELLTYANSLKALTGDRGTFSMTMLGYEEVPGLIKDKIVSARAAKDDD